MSTTAAVNPFHGVNQKWFARKAYESKIIADDFLVWHFSHLYVQYDMISCVLFRCKWWLLLWLWLLLLFSVKFTHGDTQTNHKTLNDFVISSHASLIPTLSLSLPLSFFFFRYLPCKLIQFGFHANIYSANFPHHWNHSNIRKGFYASNQCRKSG